MKGPAFYGSCVLLASLLLDLLTAALDFWCMDSMRKARDMLTTDGPSNAFTDGVIAYVIIMSILGVGGKVLVVFFTILQYDKFKDDKWKKYPLVVFSVLLVAHDFGVGMLYWGYTSCVGKASYMAHIVIIPRCIALLSNTIKIICLPIVHEVRDFVNKKVKHLHGVIYALCVTAYIGNIIVLAFLAPSPSQLLLPSQQADHLSQVGLYLVQPEKLTAVTADTDAGRLNVSQFQMPVYATYQTDAGDITKLAQMHDIMTSKHRGFIILEHSRDEYGSISYRKYTLHCLTRNLTYQPSDTWCPQCQKNIQFTFRYFPPQHYIFPFGKLEYNFRTSSNLDVWTTLKLWETDNDIVMLGGADNITDGDRFVTLYKPWPGHCHRRPVYHDFPSCSGSERILPPQWVLIIVITMTFVEFCNST